MRVHTADCPRFSPVTAMISTGPSCLKLHSSFATLIVSVFVFAVLCLKFSTLTAGGSTIAPRRSKSTSAVRALISRTLPNGFRQSSHSHSCLDSARRDIVGSSLIAVTMRSTTSVPNHWPLTHTHHSYPNRFPVSSVSKRQVIDRAHSRADAPHPLVSQACYTQRASRIIG